MLSTPQPKRVLRRWSEWLFKLALSAVAVAFAARKIPVSDILEAMSQVNYLAALGSAAVYVALIIPVEAGRFMYSGRMVQEPQLSFARWALFLSESRAFIYALPASAGADGIVWLRLRQQGWRHSGCALVVLFMRLAGMGMWAFAAALALVVSHPLSEFMAMAPSVLRSPLAWGSGGLIVLAAIALAPVLLPRLGRLDASPFQLSTLLKALLTAMVSTLVNTAGVVAASRACNVPLTFELSMGIMALMNFAMILPISIGGIGIQEALFLSVGERMGYSPSALLACSAMVHMQRIVLASVGGVVFLLDKRTPVKPSEPSLSPVETVDE